MRRSRLNKLCSPRFFCPFCLSLRKTKYTGGSLGTTSNFTVSSWDLFPPIPFDSTSFYDNPFIEKVKIPDGLLCNYCLGFVKTANLSDLLLSVVIYFGSRKVSISTYKINRDIVNPNLLLNTYPSNEDSDEIVKASIPLQTLKEDDYTTY